MLICHDPWTIFFRHFRVWFKPLNDSFLNLSWVRNPWKISIHAKCWILFRILLQIINNRILKAEDIHIGKCVRVVYKEFVEFNFGKLNWISFKLNMKYFLIFLGYFEFQLMINEISWVIDQKDSNIKVIKTLKVIFETTEANSHLKICLLLMFHALSRTCNHQFISTLV